MQGFKSWLQIIFLLSVVVLTACNDDQPAKVADNPVETADHGDWAKHLGWHTQGVISKNAHIRIVFNHAVVDESMVGESANDVVSIEPTIPGELVFVSPTEVTLTPESSLHPDSKYQVTVNPQQLIDVDKKLLPYQFSFSVIPLDYEINVLGLSASQQAGFTKLTVQLRTSDSVEKEKAQQVIQARIGDADLTVKVHQVSDNRLFTFVIDQIPQTEVESDLTLAWDTTVIGLNEKSERSIRIPAEDEFVINQVDVFNPDDGVSVVHISTSQQLKTDQNLDGLIEIEGVKFTYSINPSHIMLYPTNVVSGSHKLIIHEGILSAQGKRLGASEHSIVFPETKPQVEFVGNGVILPDGKALEIPFKAIGVRSVKLTAFEVYPDNMGQFLQNNALKNDKELGRVGRYLWQKTIMLDAEQLSEQGRFYSFDVSELMNSYSGSLLRLTLSFDPSNLDVDCQNPIDVSDDQAVLDDLEDYKANQASGWDGIEDYYYDMEDFDWDKQDDPCNPAYFVHHKKKVSASRNYIATNIGLVVKKDVHGEFLAVATDLRTAKPLSNVKLDVRNFQGQSLTKASTDTNGFAKFSARDATPFLLVATKNNDTSYLKLNAKTALMTSHFDVSGEKNSNGLKGVIYGERGVWRPGDNIYLTFVLQDKDVQIPDNHPVKMTLLDPAGRVVDEKTNQSPVNDFYAFEFLTNSQAVTGNYIARAEIGGAVFTKSILIEMVRPNRLKIELDFGDEEVVYGYEDPPEISLFSQWLHGASAAGLTADVSVRFSEKTTQFGRFSDFVFDDPARQLAGEDLPSYEGILDENGKMNFPFFAKPEAEMPGMLTARITSRVFEEGGEFSISRQSVDYFPYEHYVGIKLPKGDEVRNMLLTDVEHTIEIASLNAKGEPVSLDEVEVTLFKIDWKWWWDKSSESLAKYAEAETSHQLQQSVVSTSDGLGNAQFEIEYPDWGRYLIRVCDKKGGHCSGKTLYVDWPGWAGRAQEEGSGTASRLNLFSDKTTYEVGETAVISLPEAMQGRGLLTIESGSKILDSQWVNFDGKRETLELPITDEMAPNVFVSLVYLQAHEGKDNDRPIRLYGIIPINVSNPETHLAPELSLAESWQPTSVQTVKVSEKNGRKMTYTLAVVDEGLLGLTNFKTPDLHRYFYRKENLGITTWDLYDDVAGAYSGVLERMIAIGGDMEETEMDDSARPKRFPPVSMYYGPFELKAGETKEHTVELPAYLGAVRVMVVAADQTAYGKAHQSIPVTQPLLMLPSLPRVLKTNEELMIPVTIFAIDETIKQVSISLQTNELIEIVGDSTRDVTFVKPGETIAYLRVKTRGLTGNGKLQFVAKSGEHEFATEIAIDVRNSNNPTKVMQTRIIAPGEITSLNLQPFGVPGSNQAHLELSDVPPLNLEKHLDYLIRYPHGCLEQTTSAIFPQLYLSQLMKLSVEEKAGIEKHINAAIEKIKRFQKPSGDFSYWPGAWDGNDWSSLYAGHFLLEAKQQGYFIQSTLLSHWLTFQGEKAKRWAAGNQIKTQAYRLYLLALAGKPELGAMNRLRESSTLNLEAKWFLASAYQLAGQENAAQGLVRGLDATQSTQLADDDETFSSSLTDLGQRILNSHLLNQSTDVDVLIKQVSMELSNDTVHSTHGIGWALLAVAQHLSGQEGEISAVYTLGDANAVIVNDKTPFFKTALGQLDDKKSTALQIDNKSNKTLYATSFTQGLPALGDEVSINEGLELTAYYIDIKRAEMLAIKPNVDILQGTDIVIETYVRNISERKLTNLALSMPVATGWEIHNPDYREKDGEAANQFEFQDVRDDVVYNYFSLAPGETKIFRILVNAAFKGEFYLPGISVEAMYDSSKYALIAGNKIHVVEELTKNVATTPDDNDVSKQVEQSEDSASQAVVDSVTSTSDDNVVEETDSETVEESSATMDENSEVVVDTDETNTPSFPLP